MEDCLRVTKPSDSDKGLHRADIHDEPPARLDGCPNEGGKVDADHDLQVKVLADESGKVPIRRGLQLEALQGQAKAATEAANKAVLHSALLDDIWTAATTNAHSVRASISEQGIQACRTFVDMEKGERLHRSFLFLDILRYY